MQVATDPTDPAEPGRPPAAQLAPALGLDAAALASPALGPPAALPAEPRAAHDDGTAPGWHATGPTAARWPAGHGTGRTTGPTGPAEDARLAHGPRAGLASPDGPPGPGSAAAGLRPAGTVERAEAKWAAGSAEGTAGGRAAAAAAGTAAAWPGPASWHGKVSS